MDDFFTHLYRDIHASDTNLGADDSGYDALEVDALLQDKPANVLVTHGGLPKLIDFGIATALRDSVAQDAPTVTVSRLFSPHYAAPEQIEGAPVTVATDVFGLGALAYRLLSGSAPHADSQSPIGYLLAITQRDVIAPSQA